MLRDGTIVEQTDACLGVRFFYLSVEDEAATRESGIAKFRDIEMLEALIPGSRDNVHRKVREEDKIRFKRQYDAFVNSNVSQIEGTSLSQFPFISSAQRKELEYLNIFTGEQLVNMPDGNIDKLGTYGRELIKKVRAFMAMAKDSAAAVAMAEENEKLRAEMDLMKEQMALILKRQEEVSNQDSPQKSRKIDNSPKVA